MQPFQTELELKRRGLQVEEAGHIELTVGGVSILMHVESVKTLAESLDLAVDSDWTILGLQK